MNLDEEQPRIFPTFDDYHAFLAHVASLRSPCRDKQGACLVNGDDKVIALAYNGSPRFTKVSLEVPASVNVLKYKTLPIDNRCTVYLTYYPDDHDLRVFREGGIKNVYVCTQNDREPSDTDKKGFDLFEVRKHHFYYNRENLRVDVSFSLASRR